MKLKRTADICSFSTKTAYLRRIKLTDSLKFMGDEIILTDLLEQTRLYFQYLTKGNTLKADLLCLDLHITKGRKIKSEDYKKTKYACVVQLSQKEKSLSKLQM